MYREGDKVMFRAGNKVIPGEVYIVDRYGIFGEGGVHYDIYSKDEKMLYKHVRDCEAVMAIDKF